uniref:Uncharacterized protein n=1 Tax=Glossina austeni TaxID=7395 RepID=A0A1A9VP36_GLOAU
MSGHHSISSTLSSSYKSLGEIIKLTHQQFLKHKIIKGINQSMMSDQYATQHNELKSSQHNLQSIQDIKIQYNFTSTHSVNVEYSALIISCYRHCSLQQLYYTLAAINPVIYTLSLLALLGAKAPLSSGYPNNPQSAPKAFFSTRNYFIGSLYESPKTFPTLLSRGKTIYLASGVYFILRSLRPAIVPSIIRFAAVFLQCWSG